MKQITSRTYLLPFLLVTCLFFLWGFARAILDVLNKHFQETLSVGIAESAWIQVVTFMGYFLMAVPAGMFISRFGYRRGVVFGLILFAVGAFLFVPSSQSGTFHSFLLCLFIIACGLAFLETSANPYVTLLGAPATATSRLNLSQSFNGMGSFLAPLVVGRFLFDNNAGDQEADISLPYLVMGVLVIVIAVVFSFVNLPDDGHGRAPERQRPAQSYGGSLHFLLHNPMFLLGLFALLCYEVGEISINSYFVNYTTGMGWIDSSSASYILSLALVVFMVGRFVGSALMLVLRAEQMLLLCALGSVLCMVGVLVFGSQEFSGSNNSNCVFSLVFLVLNYLFESIMFPTIFSLALKDVGQHAKTASSLLMMTPVGGCGFFLVAWVAEHSTPTMPFVIPLVAFFVVWVFARMCLKH